LSTLTKVLIVLLTVFSLFLSGIVVTFVANQDNQRQKADNTKRLLDAAERTRDNAQQEQVRIHQQRRESDADLTDYATVQTLLHGGLVYAVQPGEQPQEPVAAIYRY
jgi:Na+-transporting NADH:ubiquinone oxidoreductase subunit NqrC